MTYEIFNLTKKGKDIIHKNCFKIYKFLNDKFQHVPIKVLEKWPTGSINDRSHEAIKLLHLVFSKIKLISNTDNQLLLETYIGVIDNFFELFEFKKDSEVPDFIKEIISLLQEIKVITINCDNTLSTSGIKKIIKKHVKKSTDSLIKTTRSDSNKSDDSVKKSLDNTSEQKSKSLSKSTSHSSSSSSHKSNKSNKKINKKVLKKTKKIKQVKKNKSKSRSDSKSKSENKSYDSDSSPYVPSEDSSNCSEKPPEYKNEESEAPQTSYNKEDGMNSTKKLTDLILNKIQTMNEQKKPYVPRKKRKYNDKNNKKIIKKDFTPVQNITDTVSTSKFSTFTDNTKSKVKQVSIPSLSQTTIVPKDSIQSKDALLKELLLMVSQITSTAASTIKKITESNNSSYLNSDDIKNISSTINASSGSPVQSSENNITCEDKKQNTVTQSESNNQTSNTSNTSEKNNSETKSKTEKPIDNASIISENKKKKIINEYLEREKKKNLNCVDNNSNLNYSQDATNNSDPTEKSQYSCQCANGVDEELLTKYENPSNDSLKQSYDGNSYENSSDESGIPFGGVFELEYETDNKKSTYQTEKNKTSYDNSYISSHEPSELKEKFKKKYESNKTKRNEESSNYSETTQSELNKTKRNEESSNYSEKTQSELNKTKKKQRDAHNYVDVNRTKKNHRDTYKYSEESPAELIKTKKRGRESSNDSEDINKELDMLWKYTYRNTYNLKNDNSSVNSLLQYKNKKFLDKNSPKNISKSDYSEDINTYTTNKTSLDFTNDKKKKTDNFKYAKYCGNVDKNFITTESTDTSYNTPSKIYFLKKYNDNKFTFDNMSKQSNTNYFDDFTQSSREIYKPSGNTDLVICGNKYTKKYENDKNDIATSNSTIDIGKILEQYKHYIDESTNSQITDLPKEDKYETEINTEKKDSDNASIINTNCTKNNDDKTNECVEKFTQFNKLLEYMLQLIKGILSSLLLSDNLLSYTYNEILNQFYGNMKLIANKMNKISKYIDKNKIPDMKIPEFIIQLITPENVKNNIEIQIKINRSVVYLKTISYYYSDDQIKEKIEDTRNVLSQLICEINDVLTNNEKIKI